jgi:hypothetical protein
MKWGAGYILALIIAGVIACNSRSEKPGDKNSTASPATSSGNDQSAACDTGVVMDPNDPKPMALMMRAVAVNADSMRAQLMRGEKLESSKYPSIRFHLAEPTDASVLEPRFFENARFYHKAYSEIFSHPDEQEKYYNVMIGKCVNCHESYCSGPLRRIRKMYLPLEK